MKNESIFITGTDTGVGKTLISSVVVTAFRSLGKDVAYLKPVQTGDDSDTLSVENLAQLPSSKRVDPVYFFPEPQAPSRAASLHGVEIQIDRILGEFERLSEKNRIVEGAGGLLVPLNAKQTIADLAQALGTEILIVCSTRLGTINHTLLTIEAALRRNLPVLGLVLNGNPDPGLKEILEKFSGVPVLAEISWLSSVGAAEVKAIAQRCFPAGHPIFSEKP